MTMWQVYWLTRLDCFHHLLFFIALTAFIVSITCWGAYLASEFKEVLAKKIGFVSTMFLIFSGLFFCLLPNTKEMCFIYVVPKIANSELIKNMGEHGIEIEKLAADYIKTKLSNLK